MFDILASCNPALTQDLEARWEALRQQNLEKSSQQTQDQSELERRAADATSAELFLIRFLIYGLYKLLNYVLY